MVITTISIHSRRCRNSGRCRRNDTARGATGQSILVFDAERAQLLLYDCLLGCNGQILTHANVDACGIVWMVLDIDALDSLCNQGAGVVTAHVCGCGENRRRVSPSERRKMRKRRLLSLTEAKGIKQERRKKIRDGAITDRLCAS